MFIPRWWSPVFLFISALIAASAAADENSRKPETLSSDEAFVADVAMQSDGTVVASWDIADGYYMYKSKFRFSVEGNEAVKLGSIGFPSGEIKDDKYFGTQEIYRDQVQLTIPVNAAQAGDFTLKVKYQGCAEQGVCYPPKRKSFDLAVNAVNPPSSDTGSTDSGAQAVTAEPASTATSAAAVTTRESQLTNLLREGHFLTILGVFFLGGVALTFTPCVLPMIPILSSIIVGQKKEMKKTECFALSLSYVLGMATTYAILGTILGVAGNNVVAYLQNPWVISVFAVLFVLLSLSMFGLYELRLPQGVQDKLNTLNNKQQGGTYVGTLIMGALSALVVSPCVSAPLAGALIYISTTQGGALLGGTALFSLGMGMGVPLLIIGTGGAHLIPRAGMWMNGVKAFFGVMLLAVAIWFLDRILPAPVIMGLWGALLLGCGIYLGGLDFGHKEGWAQFRKAIGFGAVLYGSLLWIGVASGATNPLQPLANTRFSSLAASESVGAPASDINEEFVTVASLPELEKELARAAERGEPVFLDFFAEWCVSCKVMEHEVFPHPSVESRLDNFYLIRADVTDESELLEHYNLFGPPSLLFFSDEGKELSQFHVRSEIPVEELVPHLDSVMQVVQQSLPASGGNLALNP